MSLEEGYIIEDDYIIVGFDIVPVDRDLLGSFRNRPSGKLLRGSEVIDYGLSISLEVLKMATSNEPITMEHVRALEDLIKECWETAEEKGFHKASTTVTERLMLIVSEAAEAMEEVRNGRNAKFRVVTDTGKPEGFGSELADIIIRVFDLAMQENIDLAKEIIEKMAYNKTRAYMHGGKQF